MKLKNLIRDNYCFLILFLVFLISRILKFDDILWYETAGEISQCMQFITLKGQLFITGFPHFPFSLILYKIGMLILKNSLIGTKVIHLILNILTFVLIYKTSLLFYNDKKTANRAILLYTVGFYAYAGSTMGIDQDLGLNPLLFILTLYLYKKSKNFSLKNILLISCSATLLSMSRLILGLIVMGIIGLDMFINNIIINKKLKLITFIKSYLKLFIPYILLTFILGYITYLILPDPVLQELNGYLDVFIGGRFNDTNLLTRLSFLGQVFLYTTPLILSLVLLLTEWRKHQLLLISSIIMILYMLVGSSSGDPARRMMPILPVFTILRGYLCSNYINKKNWYLCIFIIILLIGFNYLALDYTHLPSGVSDFLSNPLNNVYILSTTVFSPIYIDSKFVFSTTLLSLLLFCYALFSKKSFSKALFLLYSLGFNLFFVCTDFFQLKQPDIVSIDNQMYNFCKENCSLSGNIYADRLSKDTVMCGLNDKELGTMFKFKLSNSEKEKINSLYKELNILEGVNLFTKENDNIDVMNSIESGYVFLIHYYGVNDDKYMEFLNNKCELIEKFYGKNKFVYGIAFYCN